MHAVDGLGLEGPIVAWVEVEIGEGAAGVSARATAARRVELTPALLGADRLRRLSDFVAVRALVPEVRAVGGTRDADRRPGRHPPRRPGRRDLRPAIAGSLGIEVRRTLASDDPWTVALVR
jgi:hypothetical protein